MKISVVYITHRYQPETEWLVDSLLPQMRIDELDLIFVAPKHSRIPPYGFTRTVEPKPTVWSGPHRLTGSDWWSASNARNTGIALAKHDFIAFVDDRSVLLPGWLDCVRKAQEGEYCVCGTYQKVDNAVVEDGRIVTANVRPGRDSRLDYVEKFYEPNGMKPPYKAPGEWTYGCALALPLEWALDVNGFAEICDGLSGEDYVFGMMLQQRGYPIYFDPRMKMVEDRTPGECEPVATRRDKGVSPNDKSHALLDRMHGLDRAPNEFDLRELRKVAPKWPIPTGPTTDWYDGTPLKGIM